WIARLRTDHVAIFRVSGSKTSNAAAAALEVIVGVEALAMVIVLAVEDWAVTASEAADLVAIALVGPGRSVEEAALADLGEVEDSAVSAGVGVDDNNGLNLTQKFLQNHTTNTTNTIQLSKNI